MKEKLSEIEKIKRQHFLNYQNAIIETITNNTNALIDDDILSLIRKPPLDSMDTLRVKLLDLSRKYKTVLNTVELDKMLNDYRKSLTLCCKEIKKIRIKHLENIVKKYDGSKNEMIVIYKKDFANLNKKIRKMIKDTLIENIDYQFNKNLSKLFSDELDNSIKVKIINEFIKFMKGNYQRQFLESFDIKILVKDTTLINCIREQGDRYFFTLNNSRLLNDL